jgi:uncharacterized protein YfbU (UPF0304 family)
MERFEMRLDEDTLATMDKWRAKQNDLPSRAEAMRRLVELGLTKTTNEAVRFSDGEKLLATMMRDVYKHFKIKGEVDPDFISEVICHGHYWAPKWEMGGLFSDYEDDIRDVHFVVSVLEMWRSIEYAYEKLSKEDKERVEKEAEPFSKDVQFMGFDGNNETSHMGIARFFVEKMGRWSQFKGRELNSHMPTLATYRRMLAVFEPMHAVGAGLDVDQLIQVLKGQKHSE